MNPTLAQLETRIHAGRASSMRQEGTTSEVLESAKRQAQAKGASGAFGRLNRAGDGDRVARACLPSSLARHCLPKRFLRAERRPT